MSRRTTDSDPDEGFFPSEGASRRTPLWRLGFTSRLTPREPAPPSVGSEFRTRAAATLRERAAQYLTRLAPRPARRRSTLRVTIPTRG